MDKKFHDLYYSPKGYWKGASAIRHLSEKTGADKKTALNWLKKQDIWQIYLPAPKRIIRPSFQNSTPNDTHQIDLLFLPHDTVNRVKYKYALTVVDVASRYKEAEPLKNKSSKLVAEALKKIMRRSPLQYPRLIQCDEGAEFKGEVFQLYKSHGTIMRRGIPGVHRNQAIVEAFNKQLAERLFSYQYHKEMEYDERNREWVRRLPDVIKAMNEEVSARLGLSPIEAIKKDIVPDKSKKILDSHVIPLNTRVRYLYLPGEVEGTDEKKRATDPIWSTTIYEIESILINNPNVYYLRGGPRRAFVREELQIIN